MNNWTISNDLKFESDFINENLKVSPWAGHRRYVYDLLKYRKPKHIIELGTHYGCSFFAMCQSIKDNELDTEIHAVDTWMGDSQAGFYNDDVYQMVNKTISYSFTGISIQLHRKTFDESLDSFSDNYFDLIHIDGFHEYEAVKHDYTTFLPKLKENGIILFHDTATYTGYGSSKFWEEISQQYPSYQFDHSWGLGVLFPKGDFYYKKMIEEDIFNKILYYEAQSELDLYRIKVKDLEDLSVGRLDSMQEMERMIKDRDEVIEGQQKLIDERFETMQEMERMIKDRDEAIEGQQKLIDERFETMQEMERMIKDRDEAIEGQQKLIDERFETMQEMERMIKDRDEAIEGQQKLIDERFEMMQEMERMIKERDEAIEGQQKLIDERYEAMQEMEQMIKERDETIVGQRKLIDERYEAMQEMERMIKERDTVIAEKEEQTGK